MNEIKVIYDPDTELAIIVGPGEFTQIRVSERQARAAVVRA